MPPYRNTDPHGFGLTNSDDQLQAVREFRDAAVADGWRIDPTYANESVDRAARLTRDGYVMQVLTRDNREHKYRYTYDASVHIWGPDGLTIRTPEFYSFPEIEARAQTCSACGKTGVETTRYSFAGRCCLDCLPEMRRKHEYPGWSK